MELNIQEAKQYITEKFRNQGDFEFLPEADFEKMLDKLIELDSAYINEIGEEQPYDEDEIFDRMHGALTKEFSNYKTYLMRFVDDYMDFMEQYLVSIDAFDWE